MRDELFWDDGQPGHVPRFVVCADCGNYGIRNAYGLECDATSSFQDGVMRQMPDGCKTKMVRPLNPRERCVIRRKDGSIVYESDWFPTNDYIVRVERASDTCLLASEIY